MEENKVKIGEKYKCIASPRYTCFKIGDTYEIKDEFEAELISLCRDCFTLDEESEDEKVRQELTTFLIFNNGYYSKPSEDKIDSWIKWIDKKCEQKPTDEVKPKFNVGDWVVNKLGHVWHIDSFDKKNYQVSNGDKYNYFPISKQDEMHLWTINDAEDGDVLYTSSTASNEVFIFKGLTKEGYIDCYCSYDSEDKYCEGKHHFIGEPTFMTHPATKEKCDLLFQKMKEAGYEWDADKKELKNINQNPVNSYCQENCKGFQESGKCFADWDCKVKREAEHKLVDKVEPKFNVGDWVQIDGGHVMKILDVKKDALCYKILNWCGNESVRKISDIDSIAHLWTIQDAKDGDVLATESERPFIFKGCLDEKHPNSPVSYCGIDSTNYFYNYKGSAWWTDENVYPATKEQCDLLFSKMKEAGYEWDDEKKELNKIEKQGNQKPSWDEEDEKYSSYICAALQCYYRLREDRNNTNGQEDLDKARNWLYNKLKSLKPNNWKPSEEQMEALVIAVHDAHGRSYYEKLFSIYNYLKTL